MQWHLFLPWMTMWASTCLACMGVGYYCGHGNGYDKSQQEYIDNALDDMPYPRYTQRTDTDQEA